MERYARHDHLQVQRYATTTNNHVVLWVFFYSSNNFFGPQENALFDQKMLEKKAIDLYGFVT
jgi:hypothetical protein